MTRSRAAGELGFLSCTQAAQSTATLCQSTAGRARQTRQLKDWEATGAPSRRLDLTTMGKWLVVQYLVAWEDTIRTQASLGNGS